MFNALFSKFSGNSQAKKTPADKNVPDDNSPFTRATAAAKRRELYAEWLHASCQGNEDSELDLRTRTTLEQEVHPPARLETPGSLRNAINDRCRHEQHNIKAHEAYSKYINKHKAG